MDHFGTPDRPQDMRYVPRIAAAYLLCVQGVIGDQPAPDLHPALVADGDAIAAREDAINARDPGRQQAFAASQRSDGAGVAKHRALHFE